LKLPASYKKLYIQPYLPTDSTMVKVEFNSMECVFNLSLIDDTLNWLDCILSEVLKCKFIDGC